MAVYRAYLGTPSPESYCDPFKFCGRNQAGFCVPHLSIQIIGCYFGIAIGLGGRACNILF